MVTPFDESGRLDLDEAARLASWLVANGNDGLVVGGTTGESPVLSDREKLDLFAAVAEAVSVPVLAATGSNETAHSVELTKKASTLGIAGVLVVCPYYNRPSQAGLLGHFEAVFSATDLPGLVYDIPIRTGRRVATSTLLTLMERCPNVLGVKDAASDVAASARLVAAGPSYLELYSGEDSLTLALLAVGATGVIGVASHWAGPEFKAMFELFLADQPAAARAVNAGLLASYAFEGGDETPNPIPAKAMMRELGFAVGECRLPMGPAPATLSQSARRVLEDILSRRQTSEQSGG